MSRSSQRRSADDDTARLELSLTADERRGDLAASAGDSLRDLLADNAALCESRSSFRRRIGWSLRFRAKYNSCKAFCERPEQLVEARSGPGRSDAAERSNRVCTAGKTTSRPTCRAAAPVRRIGSGWPRQPSIRWSAGPSELFDAQLVRVEEPGEST